MTNVEVWLLAVSLAMDCFTVSITGGIIIRRICWRTCLLMAFFFGLFQALMPLIGWVCIHTIVQYFESFEAWIPWIALGLLGFIGGKMLIDGLSHEEQATSSKFTLGVIIAQAAATSIDAFAVGVGFRAQDVEIISAALIIAVTPFFIAFAAVCIGKRFGDMLGKKAELLGGAILVAIGIKSVF
mgnify:CR=1 FL=1